MHIHLGGHLNFYEAHQRAHLEIVVTGALTLAALIEQLSLPRAEIAIATINGVAAEDDAVVMDADRIEFYPPVGGG